MEAAIVDDEKVIREQIKELAVKYEPDCNVKAYETGEELLAEGKKFDVVFLDIRMESMNSIDTARALREKQEDAVVILSGKGESAKRACMGRLFKQSDDIITVR